MIIISVSIRWAVGIGFDFLRLLLYLLRRRLAFLYYLENNYCVSKAEISARLSTHVEFLHAHCVKEVPQQFMGILLSEVKILVVFRTETG